MTDYGTIKLPRDAYERHNERRKEMGLSWEEYVNGESPISNDAEGVGYDDVKSACRAAIRDELPVEQMGGR